MTINREVVLIRCGSVYSLTVSIVVICVVVAFVMPSDEGLAMEIKNIIKEEDETSSSNDVSFNNIFSRNKMLRRRMKMKKVEDDILANAG